VNHDINVIAVAVFSFWHGYDRFLRGMGQYYAAGGKRNILLHMVGDGVSMNEYKEIVEKYEIEDKVIFYGQKSGKELDKIYNISNIALECLGSHRKGISISSSLKSREYGAKGLPIITSNKIDYIPDDYKYQLRVPDDESTINMEQVIYFFDRIYQTEGDFEEVNKKIREFAEKNCDISITMRPVVEYILGED
jgi:glycosyltransferase involved in cell wall biosynthesis